MSKYDILPNFEFQNSILNIIIRYSAQFECQYKILNVKILYSASVGMSKYDTRLDFECQKTKTKKRKTKNQKRKTYNEIEYLKTKSQK